MGFTTDPEDPRLGHGGDETSVPQNDAYLVLPDEQRAKRVRPVRTAYIHEQCVGPVCDGVTTLPIPIAETYAADPSFYGSTYCCHCRQHRPVSEFVWYEDHQEVGS